MSHAKGIYVQGRWNSADLMRAPFGRVADVVLRTMLR
jgi:coniferyl-aldehyde dehydrogenase